ncbi:MAG TPA: tetratricopeptide repeat protein [Candidatus Hydrogenedentes bacterium]|nr:tetratricopeptide repeat protein [Candidatus Hydrogenedentota bacterium]
MKNRWFYCLFLAVYVHGALWAGPRTDWERLLVAGNWRALKENFRLADLRQPGTDRRLAGYVLLMTGDYVEATAAFSPAAVRYYETAAPVDSDTWVGHLLRADRLAQAGQYEEALKAADEAVRLGRDQALAYHVRGVVHAFAGEDARAQSDFAQALHLSPDLADAYAAQGVVLIGEGKPEEAARAFEQALDISPEFPAAVNGLGVALCQQGRYEEGLRAFVLAQELSQAFTVARTNADAATRLCSEGRARTRIGIVAGRRAGALGRRTLAVVVAEEVEKQAAADTVIAAVEAATGIEPRYYETTGEAVEAIQTESGPVVAAVAPADLASNGRGLAVALEGIVDEAPDAAVYFVSNGPVSAAALAGALEQVMDEAPRAVLAIESWDAVGFLDGGSGEREAAALAETGLRLRARGVDVRGYTAFDASRAWDNLPALQQAGMRVFQLPSGHMFSEDGPASSPISGLAAQLASAWTAKAGARPATSPQVCLLSTPGGSHGAFLPLPKPTGYGPGGASVRGPGGVYTGVSNGGSPQVIVSGAHGGVEVRIDVHNTHGQKPHINIEHGGKNIHTDKDGIEIGPDDEVTVVVGKGEVTIKVNGEIVKVYDVPEAENQEEVEITQKPDGTTTVTGGGQTIGTITTGPNGEKVIKVGDKTITVGGPREGDKEEDGGKTGQQEPPETEEPPKQDEGTSNPPDTVRAATILVGPNGVTIIPGPADGDDFLRPPILHGYPLPEPEPPSIADPWPEPEPPLIGDPWPPEPGPPYLTADSRKGVFTVDDSNLEIISAAEAGTETLLGNGGHSGTSGQPTLRCPFLIFQDTNPVKE